MNRGVRAVSVFFYFLMGLFELSSLQAQPVEIVFWHSMAGSLGDALQTLAQDFNHRQKDYVIQPIYKGGYVESLTSFAAAFRAHQAPSLIQVFEVGTATMLSPKGIIKPLDELMREQGLSLPERSFFSSVRYDYSEKGHLMAMPLNISVPVMFYNVHALAKIGYSEKTFPRTWDEFEVMAKKLKHAGYACAYTTAYPAWILIESFSATHGLPMIDASRKSLMFNHPKVIAHLERLRRWQRLHYFEYGGRADDATVLFTSGRCPLMSQSSGGYNSLSELLPFPVGIAALPLSTEVSMHRFHNIAGGAAIWSVAGQTDVQYQGIARFFMYLSEAQVQKKWHENTGYLPLGVEGIYQSLAKQSQHPSLRLAMEEFIGTSVTEGEHPHIGAQNHIRAINDEALEIIFAGIKPPKEAMDDAVARANHALLRFSRNTT
jgi:sn-glycerol 3-phosphate transport system substrate-binding protein